MLNKQKIILQPKPSIRTIIVIQIVAIITSNRHPCPMGVKPTAIFSLILSSQLPNSQSKIRHHIVCTLACSVHHAAIPHLHCMYVFFKKAELMLRKYFFGASVKINFSKLILVAKVSKNLAPLPPPTSHLRQTFNIYPLWKLIFKADKILNQAMKSPHLLMFRLRDSL